MSSPELQVHCIELCMQPPSTTLLMFPSYLEFSITFDYNSNSLLWSLFLYNLKK